MIPFVLAWVHLGLPLTQELGNIVRARLNAGICPSARSDHDCFSASQFLVSKAEADRVPAHA